MDFPFFGVICHCQYKFWSFNLLLLGSILVVQYPNWEIVVFTLYILNSLPMIVILNSNSIEAYMTTVKDLLLSVPNPQTLYKAINQIVKCDNCLFLRH